MIWEKIKSLFDPDPYPELTDARELGRSLVISPHPDDDVIGLGGTMSSISDRIWITYITDGGRGIPGRKPSETATLRKTETLEAAKVLGVPAENLTFLGHPDGKTQDVEFISRDIEDVFRRVDPRDLFLPSVFDSHPDHMNIAFAAARALERLKDRVNCWIYEVWTPIYPNRIIDISGVIDRKVRALQEHASQVAVIDYVEKIRGLNAFRSITARGVRYAEAFYRCPPERYIELASLPAPRKERRSD